MGTEADFTSAPEPRPESRHEPSRSGVRRAVTTARGSLLQRRLVPRHAHVDPIEGEHYARILLAFSAVAIGALMGFAVYFLVVLQSGAAGLPLIAAAAATASLPLLYRATGSARLCGRTLIVILCLITAWVSWVRGGYPTSALVFLAVVPLLAVYLLDKREAMLWLGLAGTIALVFYLRAATGDAPGVTARPDQMDLVLETAGVVGLLTVVFALAYAHQAGRERSEEERKGAQRQLVLSQRLESVGQLAGGVAHDFNNVLTVILNTTQLALHDLADGQPVTRSDLDDIQTAARRAADLTRQLLLFSRREVTRPQPVELRQLVDALMPLLRRTIPENIEIDVHIAGDVGPVLADPTQLERVLINLAVNARDAMSDGGQLTIEAEGLVLDAPFHRDGVLAPPGRYVQLTIGDTGAGMTPDVAGRIFEPFFTTKNKAIGSGLGLATVYGIVKRAGGFIWVDTEPGQGTSFSIWFPGAERAPAAVQPEPPRKPTAELLPGGGGKVVLLVEDEPDVRTTTARVLARHGYQVIVAAGADEALQLYAEHRDRIRLVLSDVVMPGLSGPKLAEQLRHQTPDLPVVLMSGYSEAEETKSASQAGIPLLSKPVTDVELLRTLARALGGGG